MSRLGWTIGLIVVIALGVVLLVWFQHGMPAREVKPRVELSGTIDFDRLFADITVEGMRRTHDRIVAHPTRLAGTIGDLEVSRLIEDEFRRLGLEVFDQSFPVTIPVTKSCRLSVADGGDVHDVSLVPFWPNLVRTCTTPPEGLVGRLIDGGTGSLADLAGKPIEGNVLLLRMTRGPDWLSAAKLGARAIVFRASDDPWHYGHKILKFPGNIPRFLAHGPIDRLIGERVRITARVDWERRMARNVYGVLRPDQPSHEVLVLMGFTDSWSVVPDLAPGHYEACSAAALLESARALAAQRQGLARTTVFVACSGVAMGAAGPRHLMDALGLRVDFEGNYALLQGRLDEEEQAAEAMERAVKAGRESGYWELDSAGENELWKRHGEEGHRAFSSVVERIIDRYIGVAEQQAAAAQLAFQQAGRPSRGEVLERLVNTSQRLSRARTASGADGLLLKQYYTDVLDASGCRARLPGALADAAVHRRREWQVQRDTVRVADLFAPFDHSYFFVLAPSTSGQQIKYEGDLAISRELDRARDAVVGRWLQHNGRAVDDSAIARRMTYAQTSSDFFTYVGRNRAFPVEKVHKSTLYHIQSTFYGMVHASFVLAGAKLPVGYQTPLDTVTDYEDLAAQTQLIVGLAAQVVAGGQSMLHAGGSSPHRRRWFSDFGGQVMTAGGSNSILPSRNVPDSLVVVKGMLGRYVHIDRTPTGVFRFPAVERGPDNLIGDAYTFDERTGEITGARDMGVDGQRQPYKVIEQEHYKEPETRVTLILKRMTPMDIFQLVGPSNQPVVLEVLDAEFRGPLQEYSITHDWENGATVFAPPGKRIYVAEHNYPHYRYYGFSLGHYAQLGQLTKGLLMGWKGSPESGARSPESRVQSPESRSDPSDAREVSHSTPDSSPWGPGYLAGAERRVIFQEADAAMSGARLNRSRLNRQIRSGLGDPADIELADKAERLLRSGLEALEDRNYTKAYRDLTASTAASMRIYPRIRTAVADAVNGILLYMFLLVPFSLFAERLLIGSGDLKTRILGTFTIFLLTFLLIRFTHPAYELVTSPMIVLVGFVIFMLCLLILSFIWSKFVQRIAELRRAGGGATEADSDISRSAAVAAAFNLGINNMRKRKVRTSYTVAALVLVSFCLVCFTAPRPELLRRQIVLGPSNVEAVMFRFERQSAGHLASLKTRYGDGARLVARRAAQRYWQMSYTPPDGAARQTSVRGALYVQPEEALVSGMDKLLLPGSRWLETDHEDVCYLSDATAATLGINPATVGGEPVEVLLAGWPVRVAGVFDSSRLESIRDLDRESLFPEYYGAYKVQQRSMQRSQKAAGRPTQKGIISMNVPATDMVILPLDSEEGGLVSSVALLFDDLPYADQQRKIEDIMDGSVTFIGYALDGLAYFGGKFRFIGLDLLVDVVVPLVIASMIVFATMLGSVFERQKEISVYSAVGLSPRHVFYLFLAESLVYAVIGVVGGYLLALILQWLSHRFGGALGLSINYSSRSVIYVTTTLMAAVVVSSFLPAWQAARIASPSERVSWSVPPATEPGRIAFHLPFTYAGRDALAVLPFLTSWFDARGEDASGEFAASRPRVEVSWPEAGRGAPAVTVAATTWLRPYDLGVSQEVRLSIEPSDDDEGSNVYVTAIDIRRISGDDTSWQRTNVRFIGLLRSHLLGWRAVPRRRKNMLFAEAVAGLRPTRPEASPG